MIIPCYNYGQYLSEAVQSVLDQTLQDFEIVVVDDGSTDEQTKQIISQLNNPKIRVIRQENKGLSAARNAGIKEAKGEFIVPLDADDKLDPTYLEKCLWVFEHNAQAGWVYTATQTFGDYDYVWLEEFDFQRFLERNLIPATAMYRKKDWEIVGGYDESFIAYEDWEFWMKFLTQDLCPVFLPEPLFLYRKHHPSMLNVVGEPNFPDIKEKIKKIHQDLYHREFVFPQNLEVHFPEGSLSSLISLARQGQDQLQENRQTISFLKGQVEDFNTSIDQLRAEHDKIWGELQQIKNSRGWKIISFLHKIRVKLPILRRW